MSRGGQTKRATRAKERARQRARDKQRAQRSGRPSNGFAPDAGRYVDEAFGWHRDADPLPRGASEILADAWHGSPIMLLVSEARAIDPDTFYAAAEPVLLGWVRELYGRGWQPTELIRFARMMCAKAAGADLIRLVIATERSTRQGPTRDDPQWLRQWDAAELPRHLPAGGWAAIWARRVPDGGDLKAILRLAVALGGAPILEQLLAPPPGVQARRPLAARRSTASNPVLERVRALLAKAESTEHESEAMAFTAKAQELMTKHAIEQAMVDAAEAGPNPPSMIRLPIDAPYADAKALLLQTVAEHTRCRALFLAELGMSHVIGYADDLEAVELLFTSLLVQAQRGLAEASATAPPGARTRSQAFRAAFLLGFTGRIGERLEEVRRLAYAGSDAASFLPVLASRDARIDEFMAERFTATTSERVRGGYDPAGYASGRMAGDAAALTSGTLPPEPDPAPPSAPSAAPQLF